MSIKSVSLDNFGPKSSFHHIHYLGSLEKRKKNISLVHKLATRRFTVSKTFLSLFSYHNNALYNWFHLDLRKISSADLKVNAIWWWTFNSKEFLTYQGQVVLLSLFQEGKNIFSTLKPLLLWSPKGQTSVPDKLWVLGQILGKHAYRDKRIE